MQGATYSGPREKLFVDTLGCPPFLYYTKYQPTYAKIFGSAIRDRFIFTCKTDDKKVILGSLRRHFAHHDRRA